LTARPPEPMMPTNTKTLDKLEWSLLTSRLAHCAQTDEGHNNCAALQPNRSANEVRQRWSDASSLRDIARSGYKAPIGPLKTPHLVFKGAEKGQILEGTDIRIIHDLLSSSKRVISFAGSFAPKSSFLQRLRSALFPLPYLLQIIEKSVAPDGQLLDDASAELAAIRSQKTALRKRIEETIVRIMHEQDVMEYLQDDFYTVRNEKYVIPMRLDGRGRIKGHIIDTSDSGQTLYLEPTAIAAMNQDLHDFDVAEKLEVIRIFRELSALIAKDLDALRLNYSELIVLDELTAEAQFAVEIDAGSVELASTPCLKLIAARHPLIKTPAGKTAEPNTIILETEPETPSTPNHQRVLIVSGPNAGGKTVVLKTTGLLHLMARAGLLIPADPSSKIFLFDHLHLEMGDGQNITQNLSTFSGHLLALKPILETAGPQDLVLLDELATGTEPQTGAAIARAILEHLASRNIFTIATTHFDNLKGLAISDRRYRNASMEYAEADYRPTYRLILDVPGQSYGLELATQIGLPQDVINRARTLKGTSHTALDQAISALQKARQESEVRRLELDKELIAAQATKARWEDECRLLADQRAKAARSVAAKLETQVDTLRSEFEDQAKELKAAVKEIRTGSLIDAKSAYEKKRAAESKLRDIESQVSHMASDGVTVELPGTPLSSDELCEGLNVYVLPLKREGVIAKLGSTATDPIEVQVGIVKVRVGILDLRKTRSPVATLSKAAKSRPLPHATREAKPELPDFVPQTPRNTLDLRGSDADTAVDRSLNFIDKCMLAGERFAVIIHGNGSDRLKSSIRSMLRGQCPYNVAFRPGESGEGGDGVTVIAID
jgi:DNA mismatch repair protein MutS2